VKPHIVYTSNTGSIKRIVITTEYVLSAKGSIVKRYVTAILLTVTLLSFLVVTFPVYADCVGWQAPPHILDIVIAIGAMRVLFAILLPCKGEGDQNP